MRPPETGQSLQFANKYFRPQEMIPDHKAPGLQQNSPACVSARVGEAVWGREGRKHPTGLSVRPSFCHFASQGALGNLSRSRICEIVIYTIAPHWVAKGTTGFPDVQRHCKSQMLPRPRGAVVLYELLLVLRTSG